MTVAKKFAVIGNPIAHSRSPEIHQAFSKQTGIELSYERILAPLDGFAQVVQDFFAQGGNGLNITVPFKEEAFALCDVLTERAKAARAVNTLWMKNGQLHGDNTDGAGLVNAITTLNWSRNHSHILILGAGGATRGVILPLANAGAAEIVIANRTLTRAESLVEDLSAFVKTTKLQVISLDQLEGHFDLIINATSASLAGEGIQLPNTLTFNYAYEMAYGKPSSFIDQAKQRGVPTADGLGMLIGQAAEAFYVWNGVRPDLSHFSL
ncbi:MAG: shikimate dehydrogenase [Gammaproteobacteria bacterium]|nr:shikimate dehydrogenase [Gammaproteobacteria bacterium]